MNNDKLTLEIMVKAHKAARSTFSYDRMVQNMLERIKNFDPTTQKMIVVSGRKYGLTMLAKLLYEEFRSKT